MYKNILVILTLLFLCSSCVTTKGQQGAIGGAAGGAILGQIIGSDAESVLLGAAIGGLVGYVIGNEMDKYDREQLNRTYESTPSYEKSSWVNPDTGKEYSVTPQPAYQEPQYDRLCRKAEIEAVIDGKKEITEAVACRENGRWVIQQQIQNVNKSELVNHIRDNIPIPVIASSGVGKVKHFSEVFKKTQAEAALAAGIFHREEVLQRR